MQLIGGISVVIQLIEFLIKLVDIDPTLKTGVGGVISGGIGEAGAAYYQVWGHYWR